MASSTARSGSRCLLRHYMCPGHRHLSCGKGSTGALLGEGLLTCQGEGKDAPCAILKQTFAAGWREGRTHSFYFVRCTLKREQKRWYELAHTYTYLLCRIRLDQYCTSRNTEISKSDPVEGQRKPDQSTSPHRENLTSGRSEFGLQCWSSLEMTSILLWPSPYEVTSDLSLEAISKGVEMQHTWRPMAECP